MSIGEDLTQDAFLGGKVSVWQPKSGYRAGSDAVLLAAACPAVSGDNVLELGLGVGTASLCLAARVEGLQITGVERDPAMAELAKRNAAENGAPLEVHTADLSELPATVKQRSFDQVIANPPYFRAGTKSQDGSRAGARHESTPLEAWVTCARKRLKPGGACTMILQADRLAELLGAFATGFGAIKVRPISARVGAPASRVLLSAKRDARAPLSLLTPLVMHDGDVHQNDGDDYSDAAQKVLRQGYALPWS